MATQTSTVPAVLDALKALLDARKATPGSPLEDVEIRTAPTGDPTPWECIAFLGQQGDQAWGAIGNRRRKETYSLQAAIFVKRRGAGEALAKEVRDRAYAILAEMEDAIRVKPRVLDTDRVIVQLTQVNLDQDWDDEGRVAALQITLGVTAELVSN